MCTLDLHFKWILINTAFQIQSEDHWQFVYLLDFTNTSILPSFFQFVPFRDFVGGRYGSDMQLSKVALAKEVLAEIPDQVLQYMRKYDISAKATGAAVPNWVKKKLKWDFVLVVVEASLAGPFAMPVGNKKHNTLCVNVFSDQKLFSFF